MNKHIDHLHCLLIGTLLLGACALPEDEAHDELAPTAAGPTEVDAENDAEPYLIGWAPIDLKCMGKNVPVMGMLDLDEQGNPVGSCELAGLPSGWTADVLFEEGSPDLLSLSASVPPRMQRFCRYQHDGAGDIEAAYNELMVFINSYPHMSINTVASDCPSFYPNADLESPAVYEGLHQGFLANVHAVDADDLAGTSFSPADIALLDTVNGGTAPNNDHGLYLEELITDLGCLTGGDCSAMTKQVLAMPRDTDWVPHYDTGGELGYFGDVAAAIYFAARDWQSGLDPLDPHRMVMLLALASDIDAQFANDSDRATVQSVIAALEFATCHGVLPVAAAGNIRDTACPDTEIGLLMPAALEDRDAPNAATCAALGADYVPNWDTNAWPVDDGGPRPLIVAVGGVGPDDENIANGRELSFPRQVATAAHAVSSNHSSARTGTSVSAAAVAAAYWAMWQLNPRMSPLEVIDGAYSSGWDIGVDADDGGFVGEDVRRLSVCAALEQAGADLGGCQAAPPDPKGSLDLFVAETHAILDDPENVIRSVAIGNPTISPPVCHAPDLTHPATPQPERPACDTCSVALPNGQSGDNDDHVAMTMSWEGKGETVTLTDGVLYLVDAAGGNLSSITLGASVITALNVNPPYDVVKVYFDEPNTASATLEFTYSDGKVESNPIPVIPPSPGT